MKVRFSVLLFVLTAFALAPINLFACACCSENGFYSIWTGKPDKYNVEVLEQIKFAETAELYLDAAGFDDIKGLEELTKDSGQDISQFSLTNLFAARTWKMSFKSANGKNGILNLPLPTQMVGFKVDIHDGKKSGGGPLLYKEWRFKGNVRTGNGFFQSGIVNPTTYFLVFQGRGNACDNVEDFTNWRLEINGKKANYKFYGELKSGAASEENN